MEQLKEMLKNKFPTVDFDNETTLTSSGILDSRLADVTAALTKAGLTITQIKAKEDWRCVIAKK